MATTIILTCCAINGLTASSRGVTPGSDDWRPSVKNTKIFGTPGRPRLKRFDAATRALDKRDVYE
jgi:hypothetical protein